MFSYGARDSKRGASASAKEALSSAKSRRSANILHTRMGVSVRAVPLRPGGPSPAATPLPTPPARLLHTRDRPAPCAGRVRERSGHHAPPRAARIASLFGAAQSARAPPSRRPRGALNTLRCHGGPGICPNWNGWGGKTLFLFCKAPNATNLFAGGTRNLSRGTQEVAWRSGHAAYSNPAIARAARALGGVGLAALALALALLLLPRARGAMIDLTDSPPPPASREPRVPLQRLGDSEGLGREGREGKRPCGVASAAPAKRARPPAAAAAAAPAAAGSLPSRAHDPRWVLVAGDDCKDEFPADGEWRGIVAARQAWQDGAFPAAMESIDGPPEPDKSAAAAAADQRCRCGQPAKKSTVGKDTPNKGRPYFHCAMRRCGFFNWADNKRASWKHYDWKRFPSFVIVSDFGFSANDLRQGGVGDCWFLSALAVVAGRRCAVPARRVCVCAWEHVCAASAGAAQKRQPPVSAGAVPLAHA